MTFCKLLAETEKDGKNISAWENTEKFSAVPYYEIYVSENGIVLQTYKTARTTWKRKYKELTRGN